MPIWIWISVAGVSYSNMASAPLWAPFLGLMGCSSAMIFCALGAGYGTALSGMSISCIAVSRPDIVMKTIIPVVMAGIIAIYGLVVSVLIAQRIDDNYTLFM
ncbi:unnamed protein product [Heterobilharzia americana]|nr:unnamed protein product [Heterobilharzia americana]